MKIDQHQEPLAIESKQQVTFDQVLIFSGGFGRLQLFTTAVLLLAFVSNSFVIYGVEFLEVYPAYETFKNGTWQPIEREQICAESMAEWRIDYSSDKTFRNWVQKLNLTCESKEIIGLIGSSYFLGMAVSSVLFPRLADIIGPKPILILTMAL